MNRTTNTPPRMHTITGDRDHIASVLRRADLDGRLVAVTDTRELAGNRVELTAQLHDPPLVNSRWEQITPWLILTGKTILALLGLAGAAALVWLAVQAVLAVITFIAAVVTWVSAHLLLLGFLAVLLLLGVCSGAAGCEGLHCRGCRR